MSQASEFVWLTDERTWGIVISHGAYTSTVKYSKGGINYEVMVENDEFISLEEMGIDYE